MKDKEEEAVIQTVIQNRKCNTNAIQMNIISTIFVIFCAYTAVLPFLVAEVQIIDRGMFV